MSKSLALNATLARIARPASLAASLIAVAALAGCSSNKSPAPIEMRTPQQATPGAKSDPVRRAEVPAAGVSTAPAAPAAKPATAPGGAETGSVKQGNVESRPLGPAPAATTGPAAATGPVSAAGPVSNSPPVKSGPKGGKRPYSETVLAEVKGADAPQAASPAATPASPPAAATPPATADTKPAPAGTFSWPSKGKISAGYSEPKHMGLSFDGQLGDPVLAAGDGKVIHSAVGPRGFGNLIIVKHDGELLTVYANNKTLLVKDGQSVKKGQKIAELGDSGTDHPKLYFEIRRQGKPVDPKQFLPAR